VAKASVASIVEEAIFYYRDQGSFPVHRHVVMPDHLHIVLTPGETTTLEKAVQLIKGAARHAKSASGQACVSL
jgi:putative transposase